LFLIALSVFSPAQEELWLLASGFPSFVPALCIVSGLVIVGTRLSIAAKIGVCVLLAFVSSFTLANGLLAWGLSFPIFLIGGEVRQWKRWAAAWTLACAICAAVYFSGYKKPHDLPDFAPAAGLRSYVQYNCAFLGSGLAAGLPVDRFLSVQHANDDQERSEKRRAARLGAAIGIGLALVTIYLAAAAYAIRRRRDQRFLRCVLPWFALGAYSIASAFLASLGRVGFGVHQSLDSRYVAFSLYLTVAVIALIAVLAAHVLNDSRKSQFRFPAKATSTALAIIYIAFYTACFSRYIFLLQKRSAHYRLGRAAILFSQILDTSEVIKSTNYPRPMEARRFAAVLDELKLLKPPLIRKANVEAARHSDADGKGVAGYCEIAALQGNQLYLSGWAALISKGRPADAVVVACQTVGKRDIVAMSSAIVGRRDVARRLRDERQYSSGWSAVVPLATQPAGAALSAWAFDADDAKLYKLSGNFTPRD
jgi:hypothetical protein